MPLFNPTLPGGSNTQVQYNNSNAFGGITGATTDGTALTLVAPVIGAATGTSLLTSSTVQGSNLKTDDTLDNTQLGINALQAITSGTKNIAIGENALVAVTSGTKNIAIGVDAGKSITGDSFNIAIGFNALPNATLPEDNICIGRDTILFDNSQFDNVIIGNVAGQGIKGSKNTAVGFAALSSDSAATGNWNIALGNEAGSLITSGSHNIVIGDAATVADITADNQLSIGTDQHGAGGYFIKGDISLLTVTPALTATGAIRGNGGFKSSDGSSGVTAGPFTVITSITVKNGIVTALTGS